MYRILTRKLLDYKLVEFRVSAGLEFLYSRTSHSAAVCAGSQQAGFWNISLWNTQFQLSWDFSIPELFILEPLYRIPIRRLLGHTLVECRILVGAGISISQTFPSWSRLCVIPSRGLLGYRLVEHKIAVGLGFLYARTPHPGAFCAGPQ